MCTYKLNLYIVVLRARKFPFIIIFLVCCTFPIIYRKQIIVLKMIRKLELRGVGETTQHLISFCQALIFTLAGEKENLSIQLCVLRISVLV